MTHHSRDGRRFGLPTDNFQIHIEMPECNIGGQEFSLW